VTLNFYKGLLCSAVQLLNLPSSPADRFSLCSRPTMTNATTNHHQFRVIDDYGVVHICCACHSSGSYSLLTASQSISNQTLIFGPLFLPYENLSSSFSLLLQNKLQQTPHICPLSFNSIIFYWHGPTTMSIVLHKHFLQEIVFCNSYIFSGRICCNGHISNGYIWNGFFFATVIFTTAILQRSYFKRP